MPETINRNWRPHGIGRISHAQSRARWFYSHVPVGSTVTCPLVPQSSTCGLLTFLHCYKRCPLVPQSHACWFHSQVRVGYLQSYTVISDAGWFHSHVPVGSSHVRGGYLHFYTVISDARWFYSRVPVGSVPQSSTCGLLTFLHCYKRCPLVQFHSQVRVGY